MGHIWLIAVGCIASEDIRQPMTLDLFAVGFDSAIFDLDTDLFSRIPDPQICNIRLKGASLELFQGPIIGLASKLRM